MALSDRDLQQFIAQRGIEAELVYPGKPTPTVPDAAEALGVETRQIIKSLVFIANDEPHLVIAAGEARISHKRLKDALGVSRRQLRMAKPSEALDITGFEVGAMPPFGHQRGLEVLVDSSSLPLHDQGSVLYGGGGSREAMLRLTLGTLLQVTQARGVPLTETEE